MKMSKKILIILIFASVLIGSFCFAQKRLEIIYPTVPGAEPPTTTKTALPEYLKYVFTFAIMVSGLLAFGALVYGGFSYLTSAGDPSKMKEGQDQIMAGFLGLIIILSSYLILNTINPQLVILEEPLIKGGGGIKIYTMANCQEDDENPSFMVSQSMADLTDPDLNWGLDGKQISSIKFLGSAGSLSVILWTGTEFGGIGTTVDYPAAAGDTEPCKQPTQSPKSISLNWKLPGVYLYASDNCAGDKYGIDYVIFQLSSATLPEFDNKTKAIKFIYGDKDPDSAEYKIKYAAILHEKENFMGEAKLFDQEQNVCKKLSENLDGSPNDISVFSITVYLKPVGEPIGNGVRFWEDKNYTGCVLPETDFYPAETKVANLHTDEYKKCGYDSDNKNCKKDTDCEDQISAMDMDGHYVALLFRDPDFKGDCEVLMTSDPDFRNNRIGQCWSWGRSDCLSSFIVKARE